MFSKLSILFLLFSIYFPTFANMPKVTIRNLSLGQTKVKLRVEDYGPGKVFVHLHANETTALAAARAVAKQSGGQVITLVHQKKRDIHFVYRGHHYEFDPNRVFTHQGVRHTLIKHHCYDPRVIPMIRSFAQTVLSSIPSGQKIIAVHNNKDYSLRDYFPKHELAHDASDYYYKPHSNYRNFYLVTSANDFMRYKKFGFNVVNQAKQATDDGSLSIALAKRQYINVEAGYGELTPQKQMLLKA
jgi:hypothetical protein